MVDSGKGSARGLGGVDCVEKVEVAGEEGCYEGRRDAGDEAGAHLVGKSRRARRRDVRLF